MIRSLVFFAIFWLVLLITAPLILPVYFLRLFNSSAIRKKYVRSLTSTWAKFTLFTAGIRLKINGKENIPPGRSGYVIISNHQGNFDVPVFVATLPFSPGFVAKIELMKVPLINGWMNAMECLPIDRKNPITARERISKRIREARKNPLVLFPEGTRSRGRKPGNFKSGSLKLIFRDQLDILPVTIDGTYKAYEENKRIKPAEVSVDFHTFIKTSSYKPEEFSRFMGDLKQIIFTGLSQQQISG